jgi:DNA-binding response OmpR family regulator
VEDDDSVSASTKEFLEQYSCQVTRVTNGVDGLQKVLNTEFDVVLCDIVTPTFPVDKFFIAVERIQPGTCDRFVFITGHMADPKWDAFIRSVHGLLLWRPFQMHELLSVVQMVIRRSRQREVKNFYCQGVAGARGTRCEQVAPEVDYHSRQHQPIGHVWDYRRTLSVTAPSSIRPHP